MIFDLDGVVRHFDAAAIPVIEQRHGLARGSIWDTAFAEPLLAEVTTGRISRAQWVTRVGELLGSFEAADAWANLRPVVDGDVLQLSDELRDAGFTTAILTNGTDTIPVEVAELGIAPRFDAIYNSAAIGYVKPDVRVFQHVLDDLGLTGAEAFFTDDSPAKLVGATTLGMASHPFTDVASLRQALKEANVLLS